MHRLPPLQIKKLNKATMTGFPVGLACCKQGIILIATGFNPWRK